MAFTRIFSSSPLLAACCFSRRSLSWEQICKKEFTDQRRQLLWWWCAVLLGTPPPRRDLVPLPVLRFVCPCGPVAPKAKAPQPANRAELYQLSGSENNGGYFRAFQDLSIPRVSLQNISHRPRRAFIVTFVQRRLVAVFHLPSILITYF